jgi:hypothetical protein
MWLRRHRPAAGSRATLDVIRSNEIDILEQYAAMRRRPEYPEVEVAYGMLVEDRASGFVGDIVRWNHEAITLRDRKQHLRYFTWKPGGFLLEGRPVTLVKPKVERAKGEPRFTNSGSIAAPATARVAVASRIWVEGRHDAELVEHIWGDDLRQLGIVVEPIHGADDLVEAVRVFEPSSDRRLGVLLDHLVPGSKESRLAAAVEHDWVLVTGHPYVDVWAGIRPRVLGLERWPEVPRGIDWKQGLCEALGVPLDGFWPMLRNKVTTYADLEPGLVGAVERLIDFVAE